MGKLEKKGDVRFVPIKKEMAARIPYIVEFYVTNETFDKNAKIQNIIFLIQDPNFQGDRTRLYETFLDLIGEDSRQYKLNESQNLQQGIGQAGGQAAPAGIAGGPAQAGLPAAAAV